MAEYDPNAPAYEPIAPTAPTAAEPSAPAEPVEPVEPAVNTASQQIGADLLSGPEPEYLVLEWFADSRYVRPRTRQYYSSLLVLVILFSLLLFLANQIVLIALVLSFFFITVVLAQVKPETVHVQLTTYGVRYQDQLIFWDEITRFWIRDIHGFEQVHLEVPEKIFRQLILLPSNQSSPVQVTVDNIVELIGRVVPYQEPLPNRFDLWVQWIERKFPLESEPVEAPASSPPVTSQEKNEEV